MEQRVHTRLPVSRGDAEIGFGSTTDPAWVVNWSPGGLLLRVANFHSFLRVLELGQRHPPCTLRFPTQPDVQARLAHIQWSGRDPGTIDVGVSFDTQVTSSRALSDLARYLQPLTPAGARHG